MKFKSSVLKKIRIQKRWTVRALAKKLGITSTTLHMWESGHHDPPIEKITALSEALGISPGEILEHESAIAEPLFADNKKEIGVSDILKNISSYEESKLEESVSNITRNVKYLSDKIKELSIVFNAIIQANPAFCYIKDNRQNYVMVSNYFLRALEINQDFDVKGKRDSDFYPSAEAVENYREDEEVIASGIALRNIERAIPGTRKTRTAIVFKTPIIGLNSKTIGLLGIFLDITERKKAQEMVEILKTALDAMDEFIWIGRDPVELEDGSIRFKEIIYSVRSNLTRRLLKDVAHLPIAEQGAYYYENIVTDTNRERHSYKKLMKNKKSEISYRVKVPEEDVELFMLDRVYMFPEKNIFVGIIMSKTME